MDGRVAVALVTVCMGTVLLFGLAPALQLARTSVNAVIKQTAAAVSQDRAAKRWTWLFLTCQLALTVVLLSKLDVTVQTYRALQTREPLVDAGHILTFATTLPTDLYNEPERRLAFYRTLGQRLIDARGAISLSVASALPLTPGGARAIVTGRTGPLRFVAARPHGVHRRHVLSNARLRRHRWTAIPR